VPPEALKAIGRQRGRFWAKRFALRTVPVPITGEPRLTNTGRDLVVAFRAGAMSSGSRATFRALWPNIHSSPNNGRAGCPPGRSKSAIKDKARRSIDAQQQRFGDLEPQFLGGLLKQLKLDRPQRAQRLRAGSHDENQTGSSKVGSNLLHAFD